MIDIEKQGDKFRVEVDGLSATDSLEVDRQAVQLAMDRYLDHLDQLYDAPPAELEDTILWLILPRRNLTWGTFRGYVLYAKLRILLSDTPQPVDCRCEVDQPTDRMLASICENYDVEYRPHSVNQHHKSRHRLRSWFEVFESRFRQYASAFVRLRLWLIFFLFVVFRPAVLKLYNTAREPVDVRFWLHPTIPQRERFFGAPFDLDLQGREIGYVCFDLMCMSSLRHFVLRGLAKVRNAFDPNHPVPVEWYVDPVDFRRTIEATPRITNIIRRAAIRTREQADSPDFAFLARQLETIPPYIVFQVLFLERALEGFADKVDDDVWSHAQVVTKYLSRLLAIVGERESIATVAVAPHYYSETRVRSYFTNREVESRESVVLPDLFVVFESRSETTLREQGIPGERIAIARDKIEDEARDIEAIQNPRESTISSPISEPDERPIRVFVPLQESTDDLGLGDALKRAADAIPEIKLVIKPHPFYSPADTLFDDLQNDDFTIANPDASLTQIIESCDICVSIYSTTIIPALAQTTPVVWVPFASPKHVSMDLIDVVGIRSDDPEEFADVLERLVHDETFYEEQARTCAQFADSELVPDADAPSLANLLNEASRDC